MKLTKSFDHRFYFIFRETPVLNPFFYLQGQFSCISLKPFGESVELLNLSFERHSKVFKIRILEKEFVIDQFAGNGSSF